VTDGTGPGCALGNGNPWPPGTNPFGVTAQSDTNCWSRVNNVDLPGALHTQAGYYIGWNIPVLIAAIDPDAEAKLDGLNKAVVSGSYLKENEGDSGPTFPVLASSDSGMDEYAQTTLQQLAAPPAMPDMNAAWASTQASAPGRPVATVRTTAQQAYNGLLEAPGPRIRGTTQSGSIAGDPIDGYWSVGPVNYQRTTAGALTPRPVVNSPSVWYTGTAAPVAMDDEDSQYRTVTSHVKPAAQSDNIDLALIKVAGVTGPGALSRERINAVAQQIAQSTGLDVDIVAGSSPSPVTIMVPAGKFGQPPLTLSQDWVKEGVAVAILKAVDKASVALFTLILVVCVLFVGNAAAAAVRGRRRELGILAALGWRRSRLFATVLGELAGIGLAAGLAAAAIAVPVSAALGLDASPGRALLAVPVAVAVAVAAGLAPAWLAARADPVSSVRPPALAAGRAHQPRGITSLALLNVARTPGRTLIGVVSLAVGVAALTLLAAVTFAFRGVIVGSLLGDTVAVQVRGVDYVAAGATVALGVLAVADVVFLNIKERAAELATIRSFGWRDTALARLVITEGAIIGATGSLAGAGLGLAAAAWFAGQLPARLLATAAAAVGAGIIITAAAALLPAALLRRLPAAHLLAEE